MELALAQDSRRARGAYLEGQNVQVVVDLLCDAVEELSNADRVGPDARKKLRGLLDHYRKMAHPFTACVRDNTKRFGPERAKKVCAVLTDIEKGTTKWRSGGRKKMGMALALQPLESQRISELPVAVDDELFALLSRVADIDYKNILGLEVAS